MTEYLIGIDGGGSKTDGLCADTSGHVLTRATTGPTSLTATTLGMASMNLVETLRQLTTELIGEMYFPKVVIGIAGLDTPDEKQRAEDVFREALSGYRIGTLTIVNDIQLVLAAGAKCENCIALIAGTGSQCFGRTADARTARTSGMDFLLADQGSGYEIGRMVLRAATCSYDGRTQRTLLEELTMKHFEVSDFDGLKSKVYFPMLNKAQVAEMAKVCVEAYQLHDPVAEEILQQITEDLIVMADAVVRRLQLTNETTDLLCSGSIARLPFVFEQIKSTLEARYPNLNITVLNQEPAYGAVRIAYKAFQGSE